MSFPLRFPKRPFNLAIAVLSLLAAPIAAHATPVYYTIGLSGEFSGTLTLELSSAVGASNATYTVDGANDLLGMTYTIDGTADGTQTFTLSQDTNAEFIYYGNPYDYVFDYNYTSHNKLPDGNLYEVASTNASDFVFYYGDNGTSDTIEDYGALTLSTSQVSPPSTPEPGSIVLLGTGALGVAGMVRRRFGARVS